MTNLSKFQCFTIIGNKLAARQETVNLANVFKINLQKTSPDIFIISPSKKLPSQEPDPKTHILIDQIRDLKRHVFQKPLSLKFKLVIIEEAQRMTIEAQNALLKILEEPPASTLIILEATNKQGLLPTVLSRTIIRRVNPQPAKSSDKIDLLKGKNVQRALDQIPQIKDPSLWLDQQIIEAYRQLVEKLQRSNKNVSVGNLPDIITKCAVAKKMIEANANSKFVLTELFFSTLP